MSEYSSSCIDMRTDEVLISAEADARRPLSRAHITRVVRLGVSLGGRRGNLAAGRIGWRLLLRLRMVTASSER